MQIWAVVVAHTLLGLSAARCGIIFRLISCLTCSFLEEKPMSNYKKSGWKSLSRSQKFFYGLSILLILSMVLGSVASIGAGF